MDSVIFCEIFQMVEWVHAKSVFAYCRHTNLYFVWRNPKLIIYSTEYGLSLAGRSQQ